MKCRFHEGFRRIAIMLSTDLSERLAKQGHPAEHAPYRCSAQQMALAAQAEGIESAVPALPGAGTHEVYRTARMRRRIRLSRTWLVRKSSATSMRWPRCKPPRRALQNPCRGATGDRRINWLLQYRAQTLGIMVPITC